MAKTPIKVNAADMSDEMQREALQCALLAVNMYENSTDIATYIKKEFNRRHQPNWHCIVGKCGYNLSPKDNFYINFNVGSRCIVLFKTD